MALHIPTKHIKSCCSGNGQTSFNSGEKDFFPRSRADFSMTNMCLRRIMLELIKKMLDLYDKML